AKRHAIVGYRSQYEQIAALFPQWWEDPRLFQREWFWRLAPSEPAASPLLQLPKIRSHDIHLEGGETDDVFLSVIIRTRGTRHGPLREAMLSLSAQTRRDFEVLIVTHDITPEDSVRLDALMEDLAGWLRERTTRLDAQGGKRGRPLNVGLSTV